MSDFEYSSASNPRGFKSIKLTSALKGLRDFEKALIKVGVLVTGEIRKNSAGRVLHRRSGRLQRSWSWYTEAMRTHGFKLKIESDAPYAWIHEAGGWAGRGHATFIPARKYVTKAIDAKWKQVTKIVEIYLNDIFK